MKIHMAGKFVPWLALLVAWAVAWPFRVAAGTGAVPDHRDARPYNILFILVDDLGVQDLHYLGSRFYRTPNIDRLARQSVDFVNAYAASPVCSPTRAALMTGKSPTRLGITTWIPGDEDAGRALSTPAVPSQLPLEEVTMAEALKSRGYRTFFAGKWHLGGSGFLPQDQGFDINMGGGEYGQPPNGAYYAPYGNAQLKDGPKGEYLADRLTDETIHFISRRDSRPFLAYLSFYDVHVPIPPAGEDARMGERGEGGPVVQDRRPMQPGLNVRIVQDNIPYAAMIQRLDRNIGRLMAALHRQGLDRDTVVIFTSDNGGYSTRFYDPQTGPLPVDYWEASEWAPPTSNAPYRYGKGWLYEGGIRVPLLIRLPQSEGAVARVNAPVVSMDLFCTVLDMGRARVADSCTDGVSLLPAMKGNDGPDATQRMLYWHFPHYQLSGNTPSSAIRAGDWKLIEYYEDGKLELFNMVADPGEYDNRVLQHPEVAAELGKRLQQALQGAQARFPSKR